MANSYIESIKALFDGEMNEGKVESLIEATTDYLKDLKERLSSTDTEVREKALATAKETGDELQAVLREGCEKLGLDLNALAALGGKLPGKEAEVVEKADREFGSVFAREKAAVRKPKRSEKIYLVG